MFFEKKPVFFLVERVTHTKFAPIVFIFIKADNGYCVSMYVFNIMGLLNVIHGFSPSSHSHGTFLLRLEGIVISLYFQLTVAVTTITLVYGLETPACVRVRKQNEFSINLYLSLPSCFTQLISVCILLYFFVNIGYRRVELHTGLFQ